MFLAFALFLAAAVLPHAVIEERFEALHPDNAERAAIMRRLFSEAGCEASAVSLQSSKLPNIHCRLAGASPDTVVVTAHYDRRRGPGEGAIDNWTGVSLLPSLVQSLRAAPRHYTFLFIAFSDEEKGLIGSREDVQGLSREERTRIVLAVNIDALASADPCASLPCGSTTCS